MLSCLLSLHSTNSLESRILRLEPLSDENMAELLKRSLLKIQGDNSDQHLFDAEDAQKPSESISLPPRIMSRVVSMAGGDARTALSLLEVAFQSPKDAPEQQVMEALKQSLVVSYDRTGDDHYDMISALHKSVRGNNGNGAMYWLARMLTAGEDPLFIARRMVVCASEDIGLADNLALPLVRPLKRYKFTCPMTLQRLWQLCRHVKSSACPSVELILPILSRTYPKHPSRLGRMRLTNERKKQPKERQQHLYQCKCATHPLD